MTRYPSIDKQIWPPRVITGVRRGATGGARRDGLLDGALDEQLFGVGGDVQVVGGNGAADRLGGAAAGRATQRPATDAQQLLDEPLALLLGLGLAWQQRPHLYRRNPRESLSFLRLNGHQRWVKLH